MFYRLVQKANPLDQEHKQRYATSVNAGKIDTRMIAKTLAQKSSLTTGDVMNVLENLMEEIPRWLAQGYSVSLGELGTFRLSLSSEGVKEQKQFNTRTIKKKVIFLPSKSFKSELKTIAFEHKK
ncbi:MAG: DNA-binding protein [candidate division SR1 bacterium]|nr:MAG: DNA-binding protein [candidate division SR1 bacterium]